MNRRPSEGAAVVINFVNFLPPDLPLFIDSVGDAFPALIGGDDFARTVPVDVELIDQHFGQDVLVNLGEGAAPRKPPGGYSIVTRDRLLVSARLRLRYQKKEV